jgi:predicted nucleotide-binding protein
VAIDPLREALEKRYSARHVRTLVTAKANKHALTRRLAMLAVARDLNMNWTRYAKPDEIAALRDVDAGRPRAAPAPAAPATREPSRATPARTTARKAGPPRKGPRDKVFVVHGRNEQIRSAIFAFLRAVDLNPVEWGQALKATGTPTPYIADALEAAIKDVAAVVVLITPDDVVQLKRQFVSKNDPDEEKKPMGQARPNVLFEGGMAFARHPEKTIFVTFGRVKSFSDIGGMHVVRMTGSAKKRGELVEKLRTAGAEPQTEGRGDWYEEGDFEIKEEDDGDNQAP